MKGYLLKYSTGSSDDYCTHDIKVYLDFNQAERYVEKFNKVISKAKEFYDSKVSKDRYGYPSITEDASDVEFVMVHKRWLFREIETAWVEEIEIVETKLDKSKWD